MVAQPSFALCQTRPTSDLDTIFHLALGDEWDEARSAGGAYHRSTVGVSLQEQGFIHCSFPGQVQEVADAFFAGRDDVVLLVIDTGRLTAELRIEAADGQGEGDDGEGERFPHLYGALNLEAVVDAVPVPLHPDGRLDVDGLLPPALRPRSTGR